MADERALFIVGAVLAVLIGAGLAQRLNGREPGAFLVPDFGDLMGGDPEEQDQTINAVEAFIVTINPSSYSAPEVPQDVGAANVRAFLDMIAYAEGTIGRGQDGYNILFGGGTFNGYEDHPRVRVPFRNTYSTAAGRYQLLSRTWDALRARLGLPDFGPASQDACAVELIRERGALRDVQAGRVAQAVGKVAKVWASLPGAGYDQPERQIASLLRAYAAAGGTMEQTA